MKATEALRAYSSDRRAVWLRGALASVVTALGATDGAAAGACHPRRAYLRGIEGVVSLLWLFFSERVFNGLKSRSGSRVRAEVRSLRRR